MTTTVCNPLDLPYRYSELTIGPLYRRVFREAADPSMVLYRDRYYLFPSMTGGFWHSDDLVNWDFVATPTLPVYDYAPDVREIDGQIVVCASKSRGTCSFYRTGDPLAGQWEEIPGTFPFFDPSLFQDDDGRVYLYWGTSNRKPIHGQELDRHTFAPIGEPVPIISGDAAAHGWERAGEDNNPTSGNNMGRIMTAIAGGGAFIEGAWMTKHGDVYYLQYAAPGTQVNTYGDGYYTSLSPLGPFAYSPNSPFSAKPGGFMTGAGHGSTVQDRHGNWWHLSTMRVSVNHMFERRIGLWPAGFDPDGVLFCNQEFADYPMTIPDGPADPWTLTGHQMLLSYRAPITASSADPDHGAHLAVNEDARTWWVAADAEPGHWITADLPPGSLVSCIQIDLADHQHAAPKRPRSDKTLTLLWPRHIDLTEPAAEVLVEGSADGARWEVLQDTRGADLSRSQLFITLAEPRQLRHVRVTGFAQPHGARLAVSGIRVFGRGAGDAPPAVIPEAQRTSPLDAHLRWAPAPGAHGYQIRWGLAADKPYHSRLQFDRTELHLRSLNAGHDYWVAVDAVNENGVTRGDAVLVRADTTTKEN